MNGFLLKRPKNLIALSLFFVVIFSLGLPQLVKDPTTDALIPIGDPANENRKLINDTFGLQDPIIIGISTVDGSSMLSESGIKLLIEAHELVKSESNVRADRVKSLVSEISISGTEAEVTADNFVTSSEIFSAETPLKIRQKIEQTSIVQNALISQDESTVLIIAELIDSKLSDLTYEKLEKSIFNLQDPRYDIYVAGQGAVSGYFNKYLSLDTKKMLPIGLSVMGLILLLTFISAKAAAGPLLLVASTAASTIGLMAWLNVPYFVITSSLPALLIAIAVADSIHLLSVYFDHRIANPAEPREHAMEKALADQILPITLTSITTLIGFVVLAYFSSMPPMYYYGVFAAVGVAIAWVLTFTLLPQITLLIKLEPTKRYSSLKVSGGDVVANLMGKVASFSLRFPWLVIAFVLGLSAAGVYFTSNVEFNRTQVENFRKDAPIRLADEQLNSKLAGTSYLDVMIKASAEEGMLSVDAIKKVAALQDFMETQPGVRKTQSIVDYLESLNNAFNPIDKLKNPGVSLSLPSEDDAIAQYILFLESSSDPTALRDKIDSKYQSVLVRAIFNDSSFQGTKPAILAIREYVDKELNDSQFKATVGGRLNVDYSWMDTLESEHAAGVIASIAAIFLFCIVLFRSVFLSLLATAPVLFSVLMIYGAMGLVGTTIEPATSMFASISLGLGVDFGIHFVHRLQKIWNEDSSMNTDALVRDIKGTARACFFNAAALGLGFSVMLFSQLPTLNRFGGLISLAAVSSFVAALLMTPALFKALRRFN